MLIISAIPARRSVHEHERNNEAAANEMLWTLAVLGGGGLFEDDGTGGGALDLPSLSRRFGEAQKFGTHRVVEYHEWQRWAGGSPARRYRWIGESGKIRFDDGERPTGSGLLDSVPAGTAVQVTRTLAGSMSTASFTETTDSNGNFTVTDTPPVAGTYTYTGSYTSDNPDILSSAGSFTVNVATPAVAGASYTPVAPVRVLDTRKGTGGFSSPVGAGKTISLQVTGHNAVPATGVTAVVLNVTATGPTASNYVTVYPDGSPARPKAPT